MKYLTMLYRLILNSWSKVMLLTHHWPPFPALNYSTLREKKKADQRDQINS